MWVLSSPHGRQKLKEPRLLRMQDKQAENTRVLTKPPTLTHELASHQGGSKIITAREMKWRRDWKRRALGA